jgi:hypothetical protein
MGCQQTNETTSELCSNIVDRLTLIDVLCKEKG